MSNLTVMKEELEREKEILQGRIGVPVSEQEAGLETISISEKEEELIESEVSVIMSEIKSIDIANLGDNLSVSDKLDKVLRHSEATTAQVQDLTSDIGKRTFVGMEDSSAKKAIDELKETLIAFDPTQFKLSEPDRILGFIPLPDSVNKKLRSYMRKFVEAESHLEDVVAGVIEAKNDSIASLESLTKFNLSLIKVSRDLKRQYLTYRGVHEQLSEHIAELKEVDPQQARFLEREVLGDLTTKMRDTLETISYARLGIIETEVLSISQKALGNELGRMVNSGRLILTIGQNIAISLHQQRETAEMITGIQKTLENLTTGTAEDLKRHARETADLANKSVGTSPEALEKAFGAAFEALDTTKKMHEEMLKNARKSLEKQEKIMERVDQKAKEMGSSELTISSLDSALSASQEIRERAMGVRGGSEKTFKFDKN